MKAQNNTNMERVFENLSGLFADMAKGDFSKVLSLGYAKPPQVKGHAGRPATRPLLTVAYPEIANMVSPNSPIKPWGLSSGSAKRLLWRCPECGDEWVAPVASRVKAKTPYCPKCVDKKLGRYTKGILADTYPKVAATVSPNSPIKATEVTVGSSKKLLWLCPECGDEWEAKVAGRVEAKNLCCSKCASKKLGMYTKGTLADTYPKVAATVSPNSPIKATEVTVGSSKKLLWLCPECGDEWKAEVAARVNSKYLTCPKCSVSAAYLKSRGTFASKHPELAKQVSPDSPIKATEVTSVSSKKLLWRCAMGHEWEQSPKSRLQGGESSICPECRKVFEVLNPRSPAPEDASEILASIGLAMKKTAVSPTTANKSGDVAKKAPKPSNFDGRRYTAPLSVTHPELAKQVSPDSPIKATEVTAGCSTKKLLWRCEKGHEWWARVHDRSGSSGSTRCPLCFPRGSAKRYTAPLSVTHPELAAEVSPDSPIKATEVTAGSSKKLLWRCKKGHEWWAEPSSRSGSNGRSACPQCVAESRGDSYYTAPLSVTHPELAKQVSPDSPIKATEVTAGSSKKLLWRCEKGHEWWAETGSRSNPNEPTNCPNCSRSQHSSRGEQQLAEFVESLLPSNIEVVRNDRTVITPYELDVYVPELKVAFEYNGDYWHSDKVVTANHKNFKSAREYHLHKFNQAATNGVKLMFVKESTWKKQQDAVKAKIAAIVNNAKTAHNSAI